MSVPLSGRSGDRAVSPVIGIILVVAITVILAAVIATFALSFGEETTETAPVVGKSSGSLEGGTADDEQLVTIYHEAGDSVDTGNMEIAVDASDACGKRGRLVNLPLDGSPDVSPDNIEGADIFDERSESLILDFEYDALASETYTAGDRVNFRIPAGDCSIEDGDELTVRVVHTPSNSVIIEQTLTAT